MNAIIFDGNFMLLKSVHTLHKINRLYGDLWNLLNNNIEKYMSMNIWDNVIIVSDSRKKSWRKKYLDKYKATRVKQADIDWDFVFKTYTEWKESIKDKYVVLEKDHIEGDDWITSTITLLNNKNKNCVIVSSDKDFYQLLKYKVTDKKTWINIQIYDILGKEKIILPIGWEIWLKAYEEKNNNDVFSLNNSMSNINFFNNIMRNWTYEEVDSYQKLFEKIIQGDKSDNISSIYQKVTSTGKLQNIGEAGASKIWNFYKTTFDITNKIDDKVIDDMIFSFQKVNNLELDKSIKNTIRENIKLNIKLIQLNINNFPEWVLEEIVEKLNENF